MNQPVNAITPITIEHELKQSYLDYAMSVIVGRALPDVRDGLKPVHRRVLYSMHELKNDWNKPFKKSARIVGDVIGKYHPHGDTAVYDTIVRMAQPFSLRYLLVDGQGNFGSVDGDSAAAMRYTEIRMTRLAHDLLTDLEKDTVDFVPNYDGTEMMPSVMPAQVPNLLINGSSGIAVGMATNIPPHNIGETINATIAMIEDPEIDTDALMQHMPGPDFPTAGFISGRAGIIKAYKTGRGKIYVRAKAEVVPNGKREQIIVTELPYQVNKARLLEKIADLVKQKRLTGISGLRDESSKDGMRMVIELSAGEIGEVVLNNLYSLTQMQTVFGINMVALDKGQPKCMPLKDMLRAFIAHRREVVTRRCIFELNKSRERAHLLEGLSVALANIDDMIQLIKESNSPAVAKEAMLAKGWEAASLAALVERVDLSQLRLPALGEQYGIRDGLYYLSPEQAQAILELRLHRLTGLEIEKIHSEYHKLSEIIADLLAILGDSDRMHAVIVEELETVKARYNDSRRTEILDSHEDLCDEDLIAQEERVVTLSQQGYVKSQSLDSYQAQRRGGRGKAATKMKDTDLLQAMLVANTHDTILCFSSIGKVYWLRVFQIPIASRTARGIPVVNLLPLSDDETITTILPVKHFDGEHYIFMASERGKVKKVALTEFAKPRSNGKIAVALPEDDRLIAATITDGEQEIMLVSNAGKAIRFNEKDVRPMGRTAAGVRGIRLKDGQKIIALIIPDDTKTLLTATENGYGQRTSLTQYRPIGRGGQGVIAIITSERNGEVVAATQVNDTDEALLITNAGTMVRIRISEISIISRNTQGMRLIRLSGDEQMVALAAIEAIEDDVEDDIDASETEEVATTAEDN
jgi:DNA gyrase subunit A